MKENELRDREMEICDDKANRNLGGGNMDVDWNILSKFLKFLNKMLRLKKKKKKPRDFPGGPAAKTPCSRCRVPRFDPWSGN